ncbi:TPA: GNAT family N-acetyltransferase [Photobacterium damselae]
MIIKKYSSNDKIIWNEFVKLSKNYHFFFERDFMEYHSDRFNDHSLMIYDDKEKLLALLPANIDKNVLYSHQGLTFGGLIIKSSAKQKEIYDIFLELKKYLKENEIKSLVYKKIPYIYNEMPCDEDLYALFRLNSNLIRRDVSSTIDLNNQIKYSKGRKWIVKKSKEHSLKYNKTNEIDEFWMHLETVLFSGHGAKPTHNKDEIKHLKELFPKNIEFYSAENEQGILAGAVVFNTHSVVHTQYLFNTNLGRDLGALDGLIDYLVKDVFKDKKYFDFGTSNENQGMFLNEGLISQKEGFGGRAVVHDFYEVSVND